MPDVSYFTVNNEKISVKDTIARQTASNAESTATTALSNSNSNKEAISNLQKLNHVEVSYNSEDENISFINS